jgi:hypothetical protein
LNPAADFQVQGRLREWIGGPELMTDFYEEDEPVEKLLAAFEAGEKGKTAVPVGFRCEHMSMTAGGGIFTGRPTAWCGCKMTAIFADDLTSA